MSYPVNLIHTYPFLLVDPSLETMGEGGRTKEITSLSKDRGLRMSPLSVFLQVPKDTKGKNKDSGTSRV